MALLVLSLSLSIFVVKLLHYSETEVKEMSISACLLDKYGSMDQSFIESAFTSMKTLDDMDQSGGRRENMIHLSCCLQASLTEIHHTTTTDGCGEKNTTSLCKKRE